MPDQPSNTPNQVNPADARTFLSNFGHSPDALKTMPDPDVLKLHGTVRTYHDTSIAEATKGLNGKTFPENWREQVAGDDKEAMATLARFNDPSALFKSYNELRGKMAKGELKAATPFPDKGSAEEQTAWRKANDIPEKHDAYDTKLGNGLVIGDDDKPIVDSYLKYAHSGNMPQGVVKQNLEWFFGQYLPEMQRTQAEADAEARTKAHETLRQKWGGNFKANVEAAKALVGELPAAAQDLFWGSRLADGTPLGDHPDVVQWLSSLAFKINPHVTLVPGDQAGQLKGVEAELREIEKAMSTDRRAYNKDEAKQARYRELVDGYEKLAGKKWK